MPPPTIPTYVPKQMLRYFQGRNVLFIGDSTARRSYTTLYAMMTAEDIHNVHSESIDSDQVIDVNRGWRQGEEVCDNPTRQIYNSTFLEELCRDLPKPNVTKDERILDQDENNAWVGKFDYIKMNCYGTVYDYIRSDDMVHDGNQTNVTPHISSLVQDYDLIVISMGIWEAILNEECTAINQTAIGSSLPRLNMTLQALKELSSPDLQIAFRTNGYDRRREGDAACMEMNEFSREFFQNLDLQRQDHVPNMTLVDWGLEIRNRSWGEDRIAGDIDPHYGLEARLLFAQMLLQELIAT